MESEYFGSVGCTSCLGVVVEFTAEQIENSSAELDANALPHRRETVMTGLLSVDHSKRAYVLQELLPTENEYLALSSTLPRGSTSEATGT